MSTTAGNENRRFKRWDIFEYALIFEENEVEPEPAIIVDLSLGGIQARSRRPFPAGGICLISIADGDNNSITTHAEIRYCHQLPNSELYSAGLRFIPGSVEQRVALVNYIHQRFQEDSDSLAI